MCLAWIRELSPIIIHVNLDTMAKFLQNDTHYRNQFETKTSGGLLSVSTRKQWERDLFGVAYDNAMPAERPKYGVQNVWNDHRGVLGCEQYGDSYIVLKDVRLRCTLTPEDSGNDVDSTRVAVLDYYAHVLNEYEVYELREILRISDGGAEKVGNSKDMDKCWGTYKEAQIHGGIELSKHVDRLVVNMRHKQRKSCKKSHTMQSYTMPHSTDTPCSVCHGSIDEDDRLKVCFDCSFVLCPKCSKDDDKGDGEDSEWPVWLRELAQKHGFKLSWMEGMESELKGREGGCEMDAEQFEKLLSRSESAKNASLFLSCRA